MVKKISKAVAAPKIKKETSPSIAYGARINRIHGQVGGVKKMIENDKDRLEIMIQLKAVRSSLKALEAEVLETHLQSSAADLALGSAAQKSKKIADLKRVFLRFE